MTVWKKTHYSSFEFFFKLLPIFFALAPALTQNINNLFKVEKGKNSDSVRFACVIFKKLTITLRFYREEKKSYRKDMKKKTVQYGDKVGHKVLNFYFTAFVHIFLK